MLKLNRLTVLLAVAAIVLLTHSEAHAQTLVFPNPLLLTITGGSGSTSSQVNVTLSTGGNPAALNILSSSVNTSSQWLCVNANSNILTVSAGTACPGYNSQLTPGTYSGAVIFNGAGATNTAQLTVTLTVTSAGTGGSGLAATPSTLAFNVSAGSGVTTQTPTITLNGAAEQISGVSWSTVSGQTWLSASTPFTGSLTVSVNTAFLNIANDSGTVLITTPAGQVSIPVSISTSGGSSSGLSASPSTLSFNVSVGSGLTQQTFSVLQNGAPVAVTNLSASTTTGAIWLQPFISGVTGQVTVQVNPSSPSSLQAGSYSGTIFVTTASGSVQVSVTLNVGSTSSSGLSASVNPVTFSLPLGSGISTQYVNINLNGQPITLTGISSSTTTGQTWLTASISGSTGQVAVTVNPGNLNTGGTYQGSVFVSTSAGSASFGVTLNLGGGSTSGLIASPSSVNFNIPLIGSSVAPQNVSITLNGVAEPIQSVTYTLNTGQNWLFVSNTGTGVLTVSTNAAAFTTAGTYSATITVSTSFGTLTIPVSTVVGSGSTSGLAVTPNPLIVNVPIGSGISSQNLSVTYNGASASITGVSSSTTTGQSWLQATVGSQPGTLLVTVNPAVVASGVAGSYSGTLFISTSAGQLSVQVTMNVGSSGSGAGLSANPNPVSFSATAGGASSSQNVSITYNGSAATIVSVNASTTTGQSWLQPSYAGSPGSVTVSVNPSLLSAAGTYTGTVTVNTTAGTTSFQVNLVIGGTAAATGGLVATPNPVNFTEATAGQTSSQNIVVTLNGLQQMVTSTTFANTPILSPTFVNTSINPDGSVTLSLNSVVTTPGFYQGKITLYTTSGASIAVPVTLTFGSGGVSSGLAASPAALTLSASFGAAPSPQNVSITYNGSPIAVSAVSATTTTGQNWLQPSFTPSATGVVTVMVNPASLSSSGAYSGTVLVSTAAGSVSFGVTLNLGGGSSSGLAASPSSLNFNLPAIGSPVAPQNASITLNGAAEPIQGVTYTLNSGQNWLLVSNAGTGIVTVSINGGAFTAAASYSGTVTVNTPAGVVTIPVSVTIGAGGASGLVATPNPLTVNLSPSSGISSQSISVTYNGVSASITGVSSSTTTGQTWLQATPGGQQGTVSVTVNPGAVSPGIAASYSGTVFISTTLGQLSVQVSMNLSFNGTSQTATISSLSPSSAPAGGQGFTLTVNGSGFLTGSTVQWNGAPLSTSFVSANQLIAPVPASLLVSQGSVSVTVLSPGAGASNAVIFTVVSNTSALSSISPNSAAAGGPAFTLTVNGSSFLAGSTVQWNGAPVSTSFVSGSQLSASVPASLIGSQGVANVSVLNPGGASSNILTFTVSASSTPAPSLSSLSPNSAAAGGPAFTLTMNGTGFLPGSTALWNGSALTTTYINGTQVTVSVGATLIANPGSASVTLANPGGSVSNALTFTITAAGNGLLIVTASPLPAGAVGAPYTQGLSVTGGATPYKGLAIVAGSLPPGISLTALGGVLTGLLNGVPTAPGAFTFTVQVTDNANATTTKQFTLTINGSAISIAAGAIVNAASLQGGSVAPGEIVVIIGSGLGPATFVGEQLDSRGYVSTLLAGTQVLFDGVAAPLGYTESGFVSAVVPYEVSGKSSTQVQVVYAGQSSNSVAVPVTAVMPGIFTSDGTGQGQGVITNQDGTVNSVNNPAPPGSIVFIYGTGEGQTTPNGVDGQPDSSPAPTPMAQPVTATIGGVNATVVYAGGVPGFVAGVLELEVQIPAGIAASGSAPVLITIGGKTTQANVTLAVGGGGS